MMIVRDSNKPIKDPIKALEWERDSAQREIRILRDKILGMTEEIDRLGAAVLTQNERYCMMEHVIKAAKEVGNNTILLRKTLKGLDKWLDER